MTKKLKVQAPPPEALARAFEDRAAGYGNRPAGTTLDPMGDPRAVVRSGRLRGDGSRTEPRNRLRLTIYLPIELGQRLDVYAARTSRERSAIVADAVEAWLAKHDR